MPRKQDVSASLSESPAQRRGPKPLLSMEQEVQLVQWVLARQRAGRRVSRDDIISQAQHLSLRDEEETKPSQPFGLGWCNRFIARYAELNLRCGGQPDTKTEVPISPKVEDVNFTKEDGVLPEAQGDKVTETMKSLEPEDQQVADATEPTKSRKYNRKHMEAAVDMYLAGRPMSEVMERFPLLHQRTVRRRVLRVQRGEGDRRRGPRPLLEGEPEQELVAWILERQARGIQLTKQEILARANEQYRALKRGESGEKRLKEGWLRRFKERHPVLSGQAPSSVRQEQFTEDGNWLSCTQSIEASGHAPSAEEKYRPLEKRSSGEERAVSAPKTQETEEKASVSAAKPLRSSSTRGSILPERRQTARKLDAMTQSSERLEELQRQQLEAKQSPPPVGSAILGAIKSSMLLLSCLLLHLVCRADAATLASSCSRVCGEYEQCFVYENAEYCAPLCAPGRCDASTTCVLRGVVPCPSEPCLPEAVCEPRPSSIGSTSPRAPSSCQLSCQLVSSPVCGSDHVSYANSCFLNQARCSTLNAHLVVASRGLCPGEKALNLAFNPPPPPTPSSSNDLCLAATTCANVLDPVCSSAGTMRNLCFFTREQRCRSTPVTLLHAGSCEASDVQPLCPATCPQTYSPVCASNGQLYGNGCLFRQAQCARRDLLAVNIAPRPLSDCQT